MTLPVIIVPTPRVMPTSPLVNLDDGTVRAEWRSYLLGITQLPAGVTDGTNAQIGQVGEVISAVVTTLVTVATGAFFTLLSLSLTAGDWSLSGLAYFQGSVSGGAEDIRAGFNTVAASLPDGSTGGLAILNTGSGGLLNTLSIPAMRLNVTAATTVHLNGYSSFASGTMQVRGFAAARRMR